MVTHKNSSVFGAAFIKAPNDSDFGKVFINNMNEHSFIGNTKEQIATMISNSKTAMFNSHNSVSEGQEYRNCEVSERFMHFLD